jgi:hypothetical protein
MDIVEDAIRDALIAAKLVGMSKVDFDWAVERVKADSYSWAAMQDTGAHEAKLLWIEQGGNV